MTSIRLHLRRGAVKQTWQQWRSVSCTRQKYVAWATLWQSVSLPVICTQPHNMTTTPSSMMTQKRTSRWPWGSRFLTAHQHNQATHYKVPFVLVHAGKYRPDNTHTKHNPGKANNAELSKENYASLVVFMTLSKESRWAYSRMLPSLHCFMVVMVWLIEFRFDFDSINRNRIDFMGNNRKFRFFPTLCMSSDPSSYPSASYRQRVTPSLVH